MTEERPDLGALSRREVMVALAGAGACVAAGRAMAKAGLGEAPAPKKGGRIRVASLSSSTADTLDPAKGGLSTDYTRHYMIYSGLTQYDGNLQAQPALAESIETADQINWTVKLRKGVAFHDGKSLTADDVVYSLLRHKDPATVSKMQAVAAQFADIRATGPLEVRVSLASANTDLPAILAASHFVIVQDGTQDFRTAVGTGPYKLREFRPGVRTVAVRNENYWRPGKPYVDQIELIGIPDESARVNALLSGDVQLINAVSPLSIRRIDRSPGHAVLQTPSANFTDLIMRQDRLPTSDPDFVMAMKYLFDRELVRKALFRGYARIANDHPIPPDHRFFNADLPQREHDPERARYHLKKAGLMKLRLPVYTSPAATGAVDMASLLQESASRIGFRLAVNRVPADGYWSRHWMKHPLTFGNTNPRPTADLVFSLFFKSDAAWNESGWRNERFDRLLIAARGEPDEAKRKNMYGEMQALVHEKCGVCIPVFIDLIDGYDRRLKGLSPIPSGAFMGYSFAEYVWLDT